MPAGVGINTRVQPLQQMKVGAFNPMAPIFSNPGVAGQLLGNYGLGLPTVPDDPVFQNVAPGSFFGQHPGIEHAISNGILGAAFTKPSMTAGEGISNVAQSFLGANDYRRQVALQNFMAPFSVADAMSGLQQRQQQMSLAQNEAQYYRQRGEWYENQFDMKKQLEAERAQHQLDLKTLEDRYKELNVDPLRVAFKAHMGELQKKYGDNIPAKEIDNVIENMYRAHSMGENAGKPGNLHPKSGQATNDPVMRALQSQLTSATSEHNNFVRSYGPMGALGALPKQVQDQIDASSRNLANIRQQMQERGRQLGYDPAEVGAMAGSYAFGGQGPTPGLMTGPTASPSTQGGAPSNQPQRTMTLGSGKGAITINY